MLDYVVERTNKYIENLLLCIIGNDRLKTGECMGGCRK